jgi:hypothetical protein
MKEAVEDNLAAVAPEIDEATIVERIIIVILVVPLLVETQNGEEMRPIVSKEVAAAALLGGRIVEIENAEMIVIVENAKEVVTVVIAGEVDMKTTHTRRLPPVIPLLMLLRIPIAGPWNPVNMVLQVQ